MAPYLDFMACMLYTTDLLVRYRIFMEPQTQDQFKFNLDSIKDSQPNSGIFNYAGHIIKL